MGRKLYIDVRPPKTGTSAIQHALRAHDNSVVIYPKVGLWGDGSHHNLVLNFYGDYRRLEVTRSDVDVLLAQIAEEAAKSDLDVVIGSVVLARRKDSERVEIARHYLRVGRTLRGHSQENTKRAGVNSGPFA